jgi:L-lactate dehydrogenase complex protein LldG
MTAREEVLARIRAALGTGTPPAGEVPRGYRADAGLDNAALISLLSQRLHDYGAGVRRCAPGAVRLTVSQALAARGARRVVVPPGLSLDGAGLGASLDGVAIVTDDGLSSGALDATDGVITTAALAIAETGTIVLDGGPGQGRRALSLVPDYHLCILDAGQIVAIVPQAVGRLDPRRPCTWISGPSATSDIELDRVQGVHGPRTLEVILIDSQLTGLAGGSFSGKKSADYLTSQTGC